MYPGQALLHAAEVFRTVGHAAAHGVKLPEGFKPEPDWVAANTRKAGIVGQLHKGLQGLLKRRKVTVIDGFGTITADGAVSVNGDTVRGKALILCTGRCRGPSPAWTSTATGGHLRPRHQQHRRRPARAGSR